MRASGPVPLRGQVWFVDIPRVGRKPFVIVSNNRRNSRLPTILAVRVTTAPQPDIPSLVRLPGSEAVKGTVVCDDIAVVRKQRLTRAAGALSRAAMALIDGGLRAALDLGS